MPVDRRKVIVFAAAAALRLGIFFIFPGFSDLLTRQVEVSTPVNSFKRLREGLFLYNRNVSPYDGGVFHQAPLLLSIFSLVPDFASNRFTIGVIYTLLDLLNARALGLVADSGEAVSSRLFVSSRSEDRLDGTIVSAAYLLNPFTVAACLGRSTSTFTNTAIIHAVSSAVQGEGFRSMVALAFASYLNMYPVLLFPPMGLLCWDRVHKIGVTSNAGASFFTKLCVFFSAGALIFLGLSYFVTGSWEFIPATYGVQLLVPDLTPNIGLWWYFFIEIFDPFRAFFLGVFWLHLASYVGSLTLRLRSQPLFVITTMLGLCAIFKPYPSISDVSLYLAFVPLYKHIFPLMRYSFLICSVLLYAILLGPAFYHLWIYAGSGNANFFYAITLVWSLGLSMLVGDSLFAILRDEWEIERPEMRGKDAKQI